MQAVSELALVQDLLGGEGVNCTEKNITSVYPILVKLSPLYHLN